MSRSYKKHPVVKDYNKGEKRLANKRVKAKLKQDPDSIGQGGNYKKAYEQWAISDFAFRMTEQDAIDWYNKNVSDPNSRESKWYLKRYPTLQDWLNEMTRQAINLLVEYWEDADDTLTPSVSDMKYGQEVYKTVNYLLLHAPERKNYETNKEN